MAKFGRLGRTAPLLAEAVYFAACQVLVTMRSCIVQGLRFFARSLKACWLTLIAGLLVEFAPLSHAWMSLPRFGAGALDRRSV